MLPLLPARLDPRARAVDWTRGGTALPPPTAGLDVIVPVHGGGEMVAECLARVVRHTDLGLHTLRVVDDASPDAATRAVLDRFAGTPGVEVVRRAARGGFVAAANDGLRRGERDAVLLNSDVEVTTGWLEKMRRAALSRPDAATVTPFSNDATICSLPTAPDANELPAGWDTDRFAALVERCAAPAYPAIPTGVGVCLLLRRAALARVGLLDEAAFGAGYGEETELCFRALAAGYVHLLDDATFVRHLGHRSFAGARAARVRHGERTLRRMHPAAWPTIAAFLAADPLRPLRERVRRELVPPLPPARRSAAPPRRVLHVVHGWPPYNLAGTELYARELAQRQAEHREVAVTARIADRCRLENEAVELIDGRIRVRLVVRNFTQRDPLARNALYDRALRQDFRRLLADFAPELVHVHHLAGHEAGLVAAAARVAPVVYQVQDWWAACARANLADRSHQPCPGPGLGRCSRCAPLTGRPPAALWNPLLHLLRRTAMQRALSQATVFIAGSHAVIDDHRRFGMLPQDAWVEVLPYAVGLAAAPPPTPEPRGGRPLRLGFVGSLMPHKGAHLLVDALRELTAEQATLDVWGDPAALPSYSAELRRQAGPAVRFHDRFAESDKARVLGGLDLLVVPSIGRESFGLVVREAFAAGVPVLAARTSGLAEAFTEGAGGGFFAPGDAADLRRRLQEIAADPGVLDRWRAGIPALKSWERHAAEIEAAYARVLAGGGGGARRTAAA